MGFNKKSYFKLGLWYKDVVIQGVKILINMLRKQIFYSLYHNVYKQFLS